MATLGAYSSRSLMRLTHDAVPACSLMAAGLLALPSLALAASNGAPRAAPPRVGLTSRGGAGHQGHTASSPKNRRLPGIVPRKGSPAVGSVQRVAPVVFLPVLIAPVVLIALPAPDAVVWQEGEGLAPDDQWADTTWDVDAPGNALVMNIDGQVALDYAEIVFDDGTTQVVDFQSTTMNPGVYSLLDFSEERGVNNVRLVAQALTPTALVNLRLAD